MEFLKDHYEKLILGVIVIGLVVAAVMVSMQAGPAAEEGSSGSVFETKAQPIDTTTNRVALERFKNAGELNFEEGHALFNPAVWRRKPDGSFMTGESLGPKGLKIKTIEPLVFWVKFADAGAGLSTRCPLQYNRVNTPDGKSTPATTMKTEMMSVGDENDLFKVVSASPAESPTEAVLEMKKDGESITLTKGKTFERIDGYIANLRYDAENRNFNNVREKSSLVLLGDTNTVVSVSADEIVLVNPATTLKTTLKYNAAP